MQSFCLFGVVGDFFLLTIDVVIDNLKSFGETENVQVPHPSSEVNSARLFHSSSETKNTDSFNN